MYKNFRQTADSLFLFCLAGLTLSTYMNPIGPKNNNGLLTCLWNTDQRYTSEEKEQVLKSGYLSKYFSLLKAQHRANSESPGLLVSRAQCFCTVVRFQRRINFLKKALLNEHWHPQHAFADDPVFVLLRFFEVPIHHF